jgi:outer membrane protein assembly factor BamA
MRETGGRVLAALHPWGKHFRFGTGFDYSSASISGGDEEDNISPTTIAFPTVAGINGADLFGTFVFMEFDGRDSAGIPRKGVLARFFVTSNDSVGRGDFGFVEYKLNLDTYLPLWSKRRVLSVRMLGDFNDVKGGSQIPFYRLARLGDSENPGFSPSSFSSVSAVLFAASRVPPRKPAPL